MQNTKTLSHLHYLGDQLLSVIPEKWKKLIKDNQKNDGDLTEQVIHTAEDFKKNQEKNADDLANIMPQTEDTTEPEAEESSINTGQMDKLLEDGAKIVTPITEYLDSED